MTRTAIACIVLILFCPRANAQTTPTILTAPFICEWANIQGGCSGMGWAAGFPTPSSPVDANCGPTSVLMLASKYGGTTPSADQISQMDDWLQSMFGTSWFYMANNGKGSGTEPPELASLARNFFGLSNSTAFSGWTLDQLKQELAQGYPVIVRVRPQMVVTDKDAHYMVLLGMDDQWVYVNDPGIRKGDYATYKVKYTLQDFIGSWAQTAAWDQHNNEGVIIHASAVFNFALDSLQVTGNVNGGAGFFDDFNGGDITSPPNFTCITPNSVIESGGFLILTDANGANTLTPGFLVDNCQLGIQAPAFRLNKGAGNSVITASFRADSPVQGQAYGLQLFTLGTSELINIQVSGGSAGVFVSAQVGPTNPSDNAAVPVNLAGVQRLMLRLVFDDATSRVTPSFSLDGGANFTPISLPQPAQVLTTGSQGIVSVFGAVKAP